MKNPLGILDSGVGGLSIVRAIKRQSPDQDILYYADTAGFPYGEKSEPEIKALVMSGLEKLASRGCRTVVLACNTASTQGLDTYQAAFPDLEIIGVTPLLTEAVRVSRSGKIIVLATFATLASDYYRVLKETVPAHVTIHAQACFDWVRLVETGQGDAELVTDQMRAYARHGIDTAVLACTHFAFLDEIIRAAAPEMTILEPGPIIAVQLERDGFLNGGRGQLDYLVTGSDKDAFAQKAKGLLVAKS
jgi:glutamate racemase